jgi:methyltransferase of ATP-grasp peptide maturase system
VKNGAGALRRELAASGTIAGSAWRAAVKAVPREAFLGDAVFRPEGAMWVPVRREEVGPEEWLRLAYEDRTWVTQVDGLDACAAPGPVAGDPTSSSTLPSLVVRTLDVAGVGEGDRVLEVGTGTGYSTALMCHRLGPEQVTSVEYDARLAARAADRLGALGYGPTLVAGDGLAGHRAGAPYDALVATCAVRSIPFSWMAQLRDGGTVTTTLSGWMLASGLARLSLCEDGGATGRFTGDRVSYMLARPHERPPRPGFFAFEGHVSDCRVDPGLLADWTGSFVAQSAAPSAELMWSGQAPMLRDVGSGSQAWTERVGDGWRVHQHGPLRLWDQVESALERWQAQGAPDQAAFGVTVCADHTQRVWIGEPDGVGWDLPA